MTRNTVRNTMWALAILGLAALPARAQYRGEEIVGTITEVDNMVLTIQREGAPDVKVRVMPRTEVEFTDRGDRRLFPNPTVEDLQVGMGVRFVYGSGVLDRIQVHYVPAVSRPKLPSPKVVKAESEKVKARIESVSRDRRQLTADVAGRRLTYQVERTSLVSRFGPGDLVVLTVEDRGMDGIVITRIESAELVGKVAWMDSRRGSIAIEVGGREETYDVEDRDIFRGIREGDRVRFEVEERSRGGKVVTSLRRY